MEDLFEGQLKMDTGIGDAGVQRTQLPIHGQFDRQQRQSRQILSHAIL